MSESGSNRYFGAGVCLLLVCLFVAVAAGGVYVVYQRIYNTPFDTHWNRAYGEPQWHEGGPTPDDLRKQNKPLDWNAPKDQGATTHPDRIK